MITHDFNDHNRGTQATVIPRGSLFIVFTFICIQKYPGIYIYRQPFAIYVLPGIRTSPNLSGIGLNCGILYVAFQCFLRQVRCIHKQLLSTSYSTWPKQYFLIHTKMNKEKNKTVLTRKMFLVFEDVRYVGLQ